MNCQRVAMRREGYSSYNGLYYLLSDHPSPALRTGLGSTSLVLNSSGTIVQQTKYKPWGEVRSGAITLTDFGFAGQRETSVGLMYFVARHYDPELGRFSQPDTLVPNPGDPASWDRYSYARNSPLNFVDPTGHDPICWGLICSDDTPDPQTPVITYPENDNDDLTAAGKEVRDLYNYWVKTYGYWTYIAGHPLDPIQVNLLALFMAIIFMS